MAKPPKGVSPQSRIVTNNYSVMAPDENYLGLNYSNLMQDWYDWLYSDDPDSRNDPYIGYLRGNVMGEKYDVASYSLRRSTTAVVEDLRTIQDRTELKGITITRDTALFFSVYDTLLVQEDTFKGRRLENTNDLRVSAREDFNEVKAAWATIRIQSGSAWSQPSPIVPDLNQFYAESLPFTLTVSADNNIKREPKWYLAGPKQYVSVALGVFLLMTFKIPGKYRIDFGGISPEDYFTRSIYDVTVEAGSQHRINDISNSSPALPSGL
jgi:hypothetical protein